MAKVTCSLCGTSVDAQTMVGSQKLEPAIVSLIKRDRPEWPGTRGICEDCREQYRAKKFLGYLEDEFDKISDMEKSLVTRLAGRGRVSRLVNQEFEAQMTVGERIADKVAQFGGSWTFIIIFSGILVTWMTINSFLVLKRPFDPYPFILLNLVLSALAALQAPVIMMSQNRQSEKDRMQAKQDYEINLMAEIEIRDLHDKLDSLRFKQWHELWHLQQRQLELLEHLHKEVSHPEEQTVEPGPYKPPEL
ncbi:MAG TPA: DUF1003 domain-containing protein [Gemmatimonadales bacterium]|jgi:uncharacterized membrane protein|nr:DUF1003 domain-containing protein [Gemmatimonadales bacterium]